MVTLLTIALAFVGIAKSQPAASVEDYETRPQPHFKPNRGQVADHKGKLVKAYAYVYQAPGLKLGLKKNGFSYNLYTVEEKPDDADRFSEATGESGDPGQKRPKPAAQQRKQLTYHYHRVDVRFKGANEDPEIIPGAQMGYYANYYRGGLSSDVTKVHSYRKLTYKNLYNNIDLVLRTKTTGKGRPKLKYNIRVRPGGDLSDVKMVYKGMDKLSLKQGKLQLSTSQGQMTETIPGSYWSESQAPVDVDYQLAGNVVSFQAQQSSKRQTLVVDPSLSWSTYLGGGGNDAGEALATDTSGNVYVTGHAQSGFPATNGAYQKSFKGVNDAFISKFSSDGNLSWSTYIGGVYADFGKDIAMDAGSGVYVTGFTFSDSFPATNEAFQRAYQANGDGFVSEFTSTGTLIWSTYLGGANDDRGQGITVGSNGSVYVTGNANAGFPTTSGAYQDSFGGNPTGGYAGDAFLTKFTGTGSLEWSTYLGGPDSDRSYRAATNGSSVYITGYAGPGFPTTPGAYQPTYGGDSDERFAGDAFIAKFNSNGSLSWTTYLGGDNDEVGLDLTTDRSGNLYVSGFTASTGFPKTSRAFQDSLGGVEDAFLSKFTSSGNLRWSTYLGTGGPDYGVGVAANGNEKIYVSGSADSAFPTTNDAYQGSFVGGDDDAFLAQFNANGSLSYSTYLGGNDEDASTDVSIGIQGNVYMTGDADSGFLTTADAYQTTYEGKNRQRGSGDAFVSKFNFATLDAGFVPDSACATETLQFRDTSVVQGNDSISQYAWQFGDGSSGSGKMPTHRYDSAGTYSVQLIATTVAGLRDTATRTARVTLAPEAAFTVDEANQCKRGNRFQFRDQSTSNNSSLRYSWAFGNGDSSLAQSPAYTYRTGGRCTVTLGATNRVGCTDTAKQSVRVYGKPEPVSIIRATTTAGGRNKLSWQPAENPIPRSYQIQRAEDQGPFRELATVPLNQRSYNDAEVSVDSHIYRYRVQLIDSCGNEGQLSQSHQPIQLQADEGEGDPELDWTAYQGWPVSAFQVRIERLEQPGFEVIPPYKRVVPDRQNLTDSLSELEAGQLCYRVVALKAGGDQETVRTTSNVRCIEPTVRLYAPDAFSPNGDGYNDAFRVKGTYIRDLTLRIYNRWGEKVYEGTGKEASWDGTYNGQQAPAGPYTYLLIAEGADGNFVHRSGSLQLIR